MKKQKRSLFDELMEGMQALEDDRLGKITLNRIVRKFPPAPPPTITADELLSLRERLRLSRAVFANYLRTNPRTLENWEQGRAKPNAQAALLIRLVEKFPDTVERLAAV
jgi:putative transcriptional regulator